MIQIKNLKGIEFESLSPKIREEITEFCSNLDKEEFPEATLICSGKIKTLEKLGTIYQKLKKKEKKSEKKLKEAERMILSISNLQHQRGAVVGIRPEVLEKPKITDRIHVSTIMETARDLVRETAQKIKRGEKLSVEEAVDFAKMSFAVANEKRGDKNPINPEAEATIIMCSDARNVVGDVLFERDIAIQSRAGNTEIGEKIDTSTIIVLGHKGYGGCGAVNGACSCHQKGVSDDLHIRAITTDHIPKSVTQNREANPAAEENVRFQVGEIQRQNPGKKVVGIIADVENKTARIVSGEKNEVAVEVCKSIEDKLKDTGDMKKQTAGFVIAVRKDRVLSAKATLDTQANEIFEVNFEVGSKNKPKVDDTAIGSAKFATANVGSVKDSKIIIVVDPIAEVALKVAQAFRKEVPGATVIAMQEDLKNSEINRIEE